MHKYSCTDQCACLYLSSMTVDRYIYRSIHITDKYIHAYKQIYIKMQRYVCKALCTCLYPSSLMMGKCAFRLYIYIYIYIYIHIYIYSLTYIDKHITH